MPITRRHRRIAATAVAALALMAPMAAAASGDGDLRQATALAAVWGRCPTSPAAHHALAVARHAPAARRAPLAHRALTAWRGVVVDCSRPVPMPVAVPGQ
ncbi:MAG: hypothetical protein U0Y82_03735 [Thermoleophilia bacterium]